MTNVLLNTLEDGVRYLTLNRPARRNALSAELVDALRDAFRAARNDGETRAVVLSGAGDKAFCSGAELDPRLIGEGAMAMHRARSGFVDMLIAAREMGRPLIVSLNGPVLAGGVGLLAVADLAIAADDVYVSTPELKRGLFPMMIMSLIRRNVGHKHAMELILSAERFDAAYMHRVGLVNRVCGREELQVQTRELARQLASFSPAVVELGRDAYYAMEDMPLGNALEFLRGQLSINTSLDDAKEGVMAFMQKREPSWSGR